VPTGAVPIPGREPAFSASGDGPAINYLCGDCNSKVPLKRGDPIRCKECGHRVLYKERTKRYFYCHLLVYIGVDIYAEWFSSRRDDGNQGDGLWPGCILEYA
jgi:DNA-directed RNA polymerase I, II, and III subunit RPABC4